MWQSLYSVFRRPKEIKKKTNSASVPLEINPRIFASSPNHNHQAMYQRHPKSSLSLRWARQELSQHTAWVGSCIGSSCLTIISFNLLVFPVYLGGSLFHLHLQVNSCLKHLMPWRRDKSQEPWVQWHHSWSQRRPNLPHMQHTACANPHGNSMDAMPRFCLMLERVLTAWGRNHVLTFLTWDCNPGFSDLS